MMDSYSTEQALTAEPHTTPAIFQKGLTEVWKLWENCECLAGVLPYSPRVIAFRVITLG